MKLGPLSYKAERINGFLNLEKHPATRQSYEFKFAYISFLSITLRAGARNEEQVNDVLSTYKRHFGIKDSDYNELQNIGGEGEEERFNSLLTLLGYCGDSLKSRKFKKSICSKLLLGEMLFFELNDAYKFNFNPVLRLYIDFCEVPLAKETEIKSLLIKMIAGADVKGLLKLKRLEVFKYLQNAANAYWVQEQADSVHVTVIATMSSGKSTLLNALIGKKVFPSENKACTSTYLKFTNRPELVREIGLAAGNHPDSRWNLTYEDIARWNGDSGIERIEIEGKMNSVSMLKRHNVSFVDTPGTNNSRNREHEAVTKRILEQKNSDVILYVLNATNLAPDDDKILLQQVVKHLGDQQIIFLLNKADQLDLEADDNLTESLAVARSHVMELGIASPVIVPISSYAAGLFRNILGNSPLTKRETRDALSLLELFRIPQYDMNRYVDRSLIQSLPQSAVHVRSHRMIQVGNKFISSREIVEAMKKTGIHILERLLLQEIKYTR
ncbi:dynamin family protein [Paenibacillus ihuae]|uniref:dynamin family protein n=1 Tax=Paenibacillus ihuae TaxID=1232431 RepID=UPI0006D55089|nr:dynamin family protein [Paenibacillus ihuae]